jgi:RNA polymerase sigma-70 factor (ECF subfamily)
MDDSALVERAAAGSREAFAALVQRHASLVVGVAFAITRDRAIAEDLAQDTFVIAWRDLAKLEDRTRIGPWLAGIARNLANSATHKRARRRTLDVLHAPPVTAATPHDQLERMQLHAELHRALDKLPAAQREALVIYYFEPGVSAR